MHDSKPNGCHCFLVLGGAVTDEVARVISNHPSVIDQKDGLFPHHGQTWRMRSFAQTA
jgi:hypothetical protein